ncbi:hypothetical protein L3Q82_013359 [Scortum barcoo]|uniref:Uncharacterized protein n=1 Tax=Scortum barcoo TaxID=214431 RepID=A0ACB8W0D5_9TELE|nr:hypothetical protein L3Q82_013359 [Scortum barcoo]
MGALSAAGKVFQTKPGNKATLECGVSSFRNSLVWKREDKMIITVAKTGFIRRGNGDTAARAKVKLNTVLEISEAKKEDAGKFTCIADTHNEDHTLLVVSVSTSPSGALQLGRQATLQCEVNGLNPSPTMQWQRPDGTTHTGSELTPVALSDKGTWHCTFSSNGETYKEGLEIKVEEPPPTTTAPSLSRDSKVIYSLDVPLNHNPSFLPSPRYVFMAQPGVTDPPSGAAQLLGFSWWVWVAGGVGCLVVVLLMVCVIILCKRIKRRKVSKRKSGNYPGSLYDALWIETQQLQQNRSKDAGERSHQASLCNPS